MAHCIGLNSNRARVTESVFDETVNSMGRAHKALHPRQLRLYDWESAFAGAIHCAGKDVFLAQCAHLCHHGICNEGHVFVLPRCVKGTTNVYESIRCREYIEDWSVASALPSVSHEASPYFFVKWDQDPHGLLLQTIIGRRQIFGCPSLPSGQNCIFPMRAGGRDDGISTLRSHQYSLTDEWVTEEVKGQTFPKHCFAPRRNKVLMRGLLDQSVRDSPVGLLACTWSGDVVVYVDNFTVPLAL